MTTVLALMTFENIFCFLFLLGFTLMLGGAERK